MTENHQNLPNVKLLNLAQRFEAQPIIGVKRKVWRKDDDHAILADKRFEAIRHEVLRRDESTCRFCGFQASKYQEVHHVDDDHTNNKLENLITACNLCHQVHHLGMFSMRGAGFLASIPEFTQTEINHLCRFIHVHGVINSEPAIYEKLLSLFSLFQARGVDTLKRAFKVDISNPYTITQILSAESDEVFNNRKELLKDIRLVSNVAAFNSGQLQFYAQKCKQQFVYNSSWDKLAETLHEVF